GALQKQWRILGIVYCLLLALSASLLLTLLAHRWWQWSLWTGLLILTIFFLIALFLFPYWRITLPDIARFLDSHLPELEESCGLLLKPTKELGPLEKLQVARTEAALTPGRAPRPLQKKLLRATCLLAGSAIVCAGIGRTIGKRLTPARAAVSSSVTPTLEKRVPGIRSAFIRITPPAYTGRTQRQQHEFNLQVEEGALLSWELQTNFPVDSLQFIFNDTIPVSLSSRNREHTLWGFAGPVKHPGFYQVKVEGRLSDLYKIEVIRDDAPHILIRTPKPYTVIDFGESQKVPLVVRLQDDYGIVDATIVATIASGSGEAVKFKEQTLRWDRAFTGYQPAYELQKTLDLSALGLKPGDELYFYCRAKDNHEQESRSDMYIISLPDTAQLMSLEGLTTGVDIKPEYFRSERQIILETEQLLKEKDTIAVSVFNNRSNDLGFDQKLLRLRYGKFLGEEAEEGGPAEGKPGEGKSGNNKPGEGRSGDVYAPGDFGNAAKILDLYTDKHDNAEDATYFEPAVKEQLKATLTEMWNAELRLRTYKPAEALPYAYKALRLLKDLQQKSRAYVAKTGVHTTPLDPARRLSGKLETIGSPIQLTQASNEPAPADFLRISLSLLEKWGKETIRNSRSVEVLQRAGRELGKEAAAHPTAYLAGYQAIRRILASAPVAAADILLAQQAIKRMLPEAEAAPSKGKAPADAGLSQLYFRNVNDPVRKQ
ncbi:MAG TPA: hypothetical protein VF939_15175, partial [Puia sp.]